GQILCNNNLWNSETHQQIEESNATSSTGNISNQSALVKGKDLPDQFGHYGAICQYCNQYWSRGKLTVMKSHLALHCKKVPDDVNNLFLQLIVEKAKKLGNEDNIDDNILLIINKKRKYISKQATLD
ncbi:5634_t:CDS:2, partial [Ambispora gerdemannii]